MPELLITTCADNELRPISLGVDPSPVVESHPPDGIAVERADLIVSGPDFAVIELRMSDKRFSVSRGLPGTDGFPTLRVFHVWDERDEDADVRCTRVTFSAYPWEGGWREAMDFDKETLTFALWKDARVAEERAKMHKAREDKSDGS
jgi:hypothetical protein